MNPVEDLLKRAYKDMDPQTGMFPEGWKCKGCGKQLNADGNHPAELYAGTYTGLCYPCTNKPYFVESTDPLDGAQKYNYPPHCPSWRREREHVFAYADCPDCAPDEQRPYRNPGFKQRGWETYKTCQTCHDRYFSHPYRMWLWKWQGVVPRAAQAAYQQRLVQATGLKKRTPKKVMEPAKLAIHDSEEGALLRKQLMEKLHRVDAHRQAIADRRLVTLLEEAAGARHLWQATPGRRCSVPNKEVAH